MKAALVATTVVAYPKASDIVIGDQLVEFSYRPKRKTNLTRKVVSVDMFAGALGEPTKSKKGLQLETGTVFIREEATLAEVDVDKFEGKGAMTVAKGDQMLIAGPGYFSAAEVLKQDKPKAKKSKKSKDKKDAKKKTKKKK